MLFSWLSRRRRARILETPFPPEWEAIIRRNVGHWALLDDEERARLRDLVQVFVEEKHWEGCGGLEMTDEVRVTVAAEACLLLLGRDHDLYEDVESILVYPSTVIAAERTAGIFERGGAVVAESEAILGQAHKGGPVILVWDAVKHGARDPDDGRSVVIHEFAHKIDMAGGAVDGTPPLPDGATRRSWAEVCSEVFLALKDGDPAVQRVIDPYGARNEAEFFAVATEAFFERPESLRGGLPALYALLADFYRQDPAARMARDA
ncbi:MAG: zinc-dependent peptidase [Deltaproteobacteria bacterium]|nr:zinc-dependent peptidase [Myxococcales bacterium]MDP3216543.1 zinc-dependent peptidase [Deltaproteobacteria bacterium]